MSYMNGKSDSYSLQQKKKLKLKDKHGFCLLTIGQHYHFIRRCYQMLGRFYPKFHSCPFLCYENRTTKKDAHRLCDNNKFNLIDFQIIADSTHNYIYYISINILQLMMLCSKKTAIFFFFLSWPRKVKEFYSQSWRVFGSSEQVVLVTNRIREWTARPILTANAHQ